MSNNHIYVIDIATREMARRQAAQKAEKWGLEQALKFIAPLSGKAVTNRVIPNHDNKYHAFQDSTIIDGYEVDLSITLKKDKWGGPVRLDIYLHGRKENMYIDACNYDPEVTTWEACADKIKQILEKYQNKTEATIEEKAALFDSMKEYIKAKNKYENKLKEYEQAHYCGYLKALAIESIKYE